MRTPQFDLPVAGDAFNLAGERGVDFDRVLREQAEAEARAREAREYQERMQKTFEDCPGFIGGDAPSGPGSLGRVVVDPRQINDAYLWLRRRFKVSESLELAREIDGGICVTVMAKPPRKPGVKWRKSSGFIAKPVQYELPLQSESDL